VKKGYKEGMVGL